MTINRALWLGSCAAAYVAAATPAHAQVKSFDIVAQPVDSAIRLLGRQGDVQVAASSKVIRGRQAGAVRGAMTVEQALGRLLAGTGLTARRTGARSWSVVASPAAVRETAYPAPVVNQPPALAQAPAVADDTPEAPDTGDIVVTAQKRSERLIDTPLSISVLCGEMLQKSGATQFRDFADTVPGLTFQSAGAGQTSITLRGVTSGYDVGPLVGIYVDDVPYGSSSAWAKGAQRALDTALFDVDRIEVLRGPQGTLYGASAMGGVLKYETKLPDPTAISGQAQAGISDTRRGGVSYNGAAAINLPLITDKIAVRASSFYSHDGGYIDNLSLGRKDVNQAEIYGARVDLLITPVDALTIRLTGFLQDISRDGTAVGDFSYDGVPIDTALDQRRQIAEPFKQQFRLVSGAINYDFGTVNLTSISSYQHVDSKTTEDGSYTFVPLLNSIFGTNLAALGVYQFQKTGKFTQEVRLASAAGNPLEWIVGGFYTHEKSENRQGFDPILDVNGNPAANTYLTFSGPSTYSELAAFGNVTYHLTSRFDVSGGLRYAHNKQVFTQNGSGAFLTSLPTSRSSEGVVTYLANAKYQFTRNANAYLRFASGYRPGGPNAVVRDPVTNVPLAPATYEADRLKSYEAGVKARTADGRFGIEAAGYHIDWTNIQVLAVRNGLSVTANAGGARIDGAELTLTAKPIRSFVATGSFAFQHARLSEDSPDIGGRKGDRLPNVPRFTATLSADYTPVGMDLSPSFGATLRYVSGRTSTYDFSTSARQYRLPEYLTVDLRAGLSTGPVDLQLFARNIFDKRGQMGSIFTSVTTAPPAFIGMLQPRTLGLLAITRF